MNTTTVVEETPLNAEQAQACATLEGQLLVLAGPGTGKTRVITYRYRNLLQLPGVGTDNIVVLTFTDKAAREMEERISTLCRTGFSDTHISTFHSFAQQFLRDEGGRPPIPREFRIAPEVDRWTTMCAVLERLRPPDLYHLPRPRDIGRDLLKLIERAKQEMAGPEDYVRVAREQVAGRRLGADIQLQLAHVYEAYQAELLEQGFLDFDDTIFWAVRLLESDESVLERYRRRFRHIMVDEFQDTNFAQLRLVELLAGPSGNVAVVGDDDQSIYKFRGASVANLRRFRQVYPGLAIVRLQQNYRSTTEVLECAHRLVTHNTERVEKRVVSDRRGPAPRMYAAPSRDHEIEWTVERIVELVESGQVPAGETAVLVRTNAMLRGFARALQRAGIPYQMSGGRGFLDQPEIKDIRALLQWAASPADTQAACRVLAMPGVGVPADLILRLSARARKDDMTLEDVAAEADLGASAESYEKMFRLLQELRQLGLRERVDEVLFHALEQTRYVHLLDYPQEIQRRQAGANIEKFRELVDRFCERDRTGTSGTLAGFVAYLEAVEESQSEQTIAPIEAGSGAVNLMTIHQAKGLEFTAVFCPGLVEDRFPFRNQPDRLALPAELIQEEAPSRDPRLAEERRLAYVALTRARRHAFVSWSERYEGGRRWKPSRFLVEMGLLPGPDGKVAIPTAPEADPAVEAPPMQVAQAALPMSHPEVAQLRVSYSRLETYRTCPRRYQYAHIYNLPARPSAEQEFGVAVHQALRQILEQSPGPQAPVEECVEVFDRVFTAIRFCDPVNADLWQERGRGFIRALHRKGRLSASALHVPPEQPFSLKLPGFLVDGRIDRIDRDGKGYRIVDYKTGDPKEEWLLERDLQLGLYAMAAEQVFNLRPVELVICYLDDATEVPVLKTTSQLAADQETAETAAAGIMAGDFTPQPEQWKCRHCDYRLVCDAAL